MIFRKIVGFILSPLMAIFGWNTPIHIINSPVPPLATTTQAVSTSIEPVIAVSPAKKATTTPKAKIVSPKISQKPETAQVAKEVVVKAPVITSDFVKINTFARSAIVNILCSTKGGELSPISGTGVVISDKGLILTNAHIAQYFLLKDYREKGFLECVARTGSPAYPTYRLELVYISPLWVEKNKALLKEQNPQGTGEYDFAFLRITGRIDGNPMPEIFPYIKLDTREVIQIGEPTLLASYPAGFLGGLSVLQDLSITTAIAYVSQLYTYSNGSIDLISVPGTVVSQKGSSGGAVVDGDTELIGIISTSSDGKSTSERDLRAITSAYINRDLQTELGLTLSQFLSQDMEFFAKKFQEINAPNLTKLITDELSK